MSPLPAIITMCHTWPPVLCHHGGSNPPLFSPQNDKIFIKKWLCLNCWNPLPLLSHIAKPAHRKLVTLYMDDALAAGLLRVPPSLPHVLLPCVVKNCYSVQFQNQFCEDINYRNYSYFYTLQFFLYLF